MGLAQLRRHLAERPGNRTRAALLELKRDPRAGARSLAEQLERALEREARERKRQDQLFAEERRLAKAGFQRVAGVDEVGMGPLAGPVVAAAVVFPPGTRLPGLRDSKQLSARAREQLAGEIRQRALCVSVRAVQPSEIDRINIYQAGLLAMKRAVRGIGSPLDFVLVDARTVPGVSPPQRAVVGGDALVGCIAAASVVAKVWRDRVMARLDRRYPGYGFERNAGYATREHLQALRRLGPAPVHRRSFAPVAQAECHTS